MTSGLNPTQARCLAFLKAEIDRGRGVCPSFNEIMVGIGSKSRGHVANILDVLEARGHISRLKGARRSIGFPKTCPHCGHPTGRG